jgi:hypothetical protein
MIKLAVADYCADCPEFEPEVDKTSLYNNCSFIPEEKTETTIYCVHSSRCRCIYEKFKKEKGERP